MPLISRRQRFEVDGRNVVVRPLAVDVAFWKRYGCVVLIHAIRQRRRGMSVRIKNVYFAEVDFGDGTGSPRRVVWEAETGSNGDRRTALSEFKLWLGVKIQDGTTRPHPRDPGEFVAIDGVLSFVRVESGRSSRHVSVSAGKVPGEAERTVTPPTWFRS